MKKEITIIIVALVLILGGAYWLNRPAPGSDQFDQLAQCIKASGATFYGAFWCPHCKAQKAEFGNAVKYLPYVECSEPDGQTQTPICISKGIQSYPTWYFADGSVENGVMSVQDLAARTNCPLPPGVPTATTTAATDQGGATVVSTSTPSVIPVAATTSVSF